MADMFLGMPTSPRGMVQWMRENPDVDWKAMRYGDELLVGLRGEDDSISAFSCLVSSEVHDQPRAEGAQGKEG